MFTIRKTKPKNDKLYMQVPKGYSRAVLGKPTDKYANVLANCFAGETKYVTSEGLKTFAETVGTVQEVLNENGEFVPAEIKSFGKQKLYKVTFNSDYVVYATANHRWVVDRFSNYKGKKYSKRVIKTTEELKDTDYIPYNLYKGNGQMSNEGIVHGIVFGDGYKCNNCKTYRIQLFGDKEELKKYIPEHIYSDYNLKEVPSIYESEEYLRGFIAGHIATDGTITKDTFKISNISLEVLKQIQNICYKIGIPTGGIYKETRNVKIGEYEYKDHTIYYLTFKRKGIDGLLLKSADIAKLTVAPKDIKYTQVKSVEETDRYEEVFCAEEPITHTITLEHNILTGQCVGYANGRFAEIQAEITGTAGIKYQLVCNAENFIEKAKGYGLNISNKPTLGGIMVWQKGKTLTSKDGAGHVAIVEKIIDSNTIYTSESAYKGSAFFNCTRKNTNGRWGMNANYKFRGCIINPAVKDEKKTIDQIAQEVIDGKWGNGLARKNALKKAGYDYDAVQKRVNEILKDKDKIKVGDTVKVLNPVSYGTNKKFKLYYKTYKVMELSGDRAVIGVNGTVTAAIDVKNLKKA